MPEFLRRPNLPNSLANSLVQLANSQVDPLAVGLQTIGKIADTFTQQQMRLQLLKKENEMREAAAETQHGRAKELKVMDRDSAIFEKLLSSDRIVEGLMGGKMTSGDAQGLMSAEGARSKALVESDFGPSPKAQPKKGAGTPLSSIGVSIPGDPSFVPSKETVQIDAAMAKKYKLPDTLIGKTLNMDQVLKLRGQDTSASGRAGRDPKLEALATKIVDEDLSLVEADTATRMAAIDKAYDALLTIRGGGKVDAPAPKPAPEKKKGGLWSSIFGFKSGEAAPAPAKAPAAEDKKRKQELIDKLKKKGHGAPRG